MPVSPFSQLERAKNSSSVVDYQRSLQGRLSAISETSRLLIESKWQGANFLEILQAELGPYLNSDRTNVSMQGPTVTLSVHASLQLALAFHELATNAAKYGALSVPEGRVSVEWLIDSGPKGDVLKLEWLENGGPEVRALTRCGFGETVVKKTIVLGLGGTWDVDYRPSGLHCRLELPLGHITSTDA